MRLRHAFLLAILGLGAQAAVAQDPAKVEAEKANVAQHKCGSIPVWPGKMATESARRSFETGMKTYGDCIRVYIDDRRAVIKANESVAKAAIEEYNATLEAARADAQTGSKPEVK